MTRSEISASAAAAGVNLANEVLTGQVVKALAERGIRCIVLKGPLLTRWLYGSDVRPSSDVDLLVSPDDFDLAETLLAKLEYELLSLEGIPHDRPWVAHEWRTQREISIDLHRGLVGADAGGREVWRVLSAETQEAPVAGGLSVQVLNGSARSLHVALHAGQHGIRHHRTVSDLERALETQPLKVWRHAAELAVQLDAVAAFASGLRMRPAGVALLRQLSLPADDSPEADLLAMSPPATAGGFAWFAGIPGLRAKGTFLLRKLFPPADWLRTWTPLARRGSLGLLAAYVWRPLWLLWHAIPGLMAWRRALRRTEVAE